MAFHQRDLGFHGRSDIAGDEARRTAADNDNITVEMRGHFAGPLGVDLPRTNAIDDFLGHERQNADQHERADQAGRKYALE